MQDRAGNVGNKQKLQNSEPRWQDRAGNLENKQQLQNSKPRCQDTSESSRAGNIGNKQKLQNSKPRWQNSSESSRALDRTILRNASNTITYFKTSVWHGGPPLLSPSPITQELMKEIANDQLGDGWLGEANGGLTPFRALMNAGDPNNTYDTPQWSASTLLGTDEMVGQYFNNQYTRVINQVSSSRRSSNSGWKSATGRVQTTNNSVGASAWTGNNKYVYDGSDYVQFKKLQAKNRNYNDPTFGGDEHNASQVARSRARR